MMSTVNTVLGPIQKSELGAALSHEHVLVASAGIQQLYPEFIDRTDTIERAVAQLSEAYNEGLRTIVEVTTIDLGRDIKLLEEVSRRTKVNIIACTGTWLDIPRVFWSATPDMIADLYVREIEDGIESTSIKAGVIKVATDIDGVTPQGEIILRAAARASIKTGVRISTHTNSIERMGEKQIAIFEEEGVSPSHICIGHSNDTTDKNYLIGMAEKGYYIGLDHYPGGRVAGSIDWQERTRILKDLIDAGIGDKLMLSHDHSTSTTTATRAAYGDRQAFNPDGYLFVSRNVLPRLEELGVDATSIERLLVQNPEEYFFGE
ncbi:phosphotriesterase-related protein [Dehalococcoidia bacterium]|nr:phosphotriesterase-related protein [Dehalococcoidia bacterium]